jgi:ribosomal protein L12E/L44/L45/RPP1/RPP2
VWFADVDDMSVVISKLESRIDKLESHVKLLEGKVLDASLLAASVTQAAPAAPAVKPKEVDEDDNVDLFGSDSEVCFMCK